MLKLDHLKEDIKKIISQGEDVKAVWVHNFNPEKKEAFFSILVDDTKHIDNIPLIEEAAREFIKKYPEGLELRPLKYLSTFLDLVKHGDPKAISSLKDSTILYDPSNFLRLLIHLIKKGTLYELDERAMKLLEKSFVNLDAVHTTLKNHLAQEISQAVIESAQAVLMYAGKNPTNAEHFGEALQKLLGTKVAREVALYNELYALEGEKLLGDIDSYLAKAKKFVKAMEDQLLDFEAAKDEKSLNEMCNYCATLYDKLMKGLALREKDFETFCVHYRDEISQVHLETLKHVLEFRKATSKEKKSFLHTKHLDRIHLNALRIVLEQQL